jgi:hypothetical protein
MFTNIECIHDDSGVRITDDKEKILNTIREEIDLGFEDWTPEMKKLVKKAIRKELKKFAKKLTR